MKAWEVLDKDGKYSQKTALICKLAYMVENGTGCCEGIRCHDCKYVRNLAACMEALNAEIKTDWSKVPVDTPILVKDNEKDEWTKAHFAKFEDGYVYSFLLGYTSWTSGSMVNWQYAKLAEE